MRPEWLIKLNNLIDEHPDAEIKFMVATEEVCCDYHRCATEEASVGLAKYAVHKDQIIEDEEDLREIIFDQLYDPELGASNEEYEGLIDKEIESKKAYHFKKAIFVYVG